VLATTVAALVGLSITTAVTLAVLSWTGEPGLAVTGIVRDAESGRAIAGARVADDDYGPEPGREAVTDAAGRYRYLTWDEEHFIVVSADGYAPQRRILLPDRSARKRGQAIVDFALACE